MLRNVNDIQKIVKSAGASPRVARAAAMRSITVEEAIDRARFPSTRIGICGTVTVSGNNHAVTRTMRVLETELSPSSVSDVQINRTTGNVIISGHVILILNALYTVRHSIDSVEVS